MKYIEKRDEPQSLSNWKEEDKMYQRKNATWKRFKKPYKLDFKNELIKEQGYVCCYCEQRIDINNSHLEHFIPQKLDEFSEYLFDYNNLLCSCQKELEKGEPRHCGNSKGSWYDKDLLVSPLDIDCESKFIYTEDGYIQHTDEDSKQTILHLQLNIDKLNNLRASAIEPFIIDPITFEEIPKDEAKKLAEYYLKRVDEKYNEFYTTIKYLFNNE